MDLWPYLVVGTTGSEIRQFCVMDTNERGWQKYRASMKGESTSKKLDMLLTWRVRHLIGAGLILPRDVQVQIDNYINALKRGGLLNEDLKVQR
jgi:hypothetical protein